MTQFESLISPVYLFTESTITHIICIWADDNLTDMHYSKKKSKTPKNKHRETENQVNTFPCGKKEEEEEEEELVVIGLTTVEVLS